MELLLPLFFFAAVVSELLAPLWGETGAKASGGRMRIKCVQEQRPEANYRDFACTHAQAT